MSHRDKITFNIYCLKYVPQEGKAYTIAGELLRATAHIYNRYYNDRDMINKGYGKETCNKPAHYLWTMAGAKVKKIIDKMKDSDYDYEEHLEMLITEVVNHIKTCPELETEYNNWDSFIDEDWESDWAEDNKERMYADITKKERDRKRYEIFKLKWMVAHGYSLIDFVSKINACYEELQAKEPVFKGCLYAKPSPDIWDAFDLFEDTGFEGGMIYPCFDEWLDNECIEDDD